eukprot:g12437.t1
MEEEEGRGGNTTRGGTNATTTAGTEPGQAVYVILEPGDATRDPQGAQNATSEGTAAQLGHEEAAMTGSAPPPMRYIVLEAGAADGGGGDPG